MDSAGDQHLHIEHNIFKRRVDLNGNPIEEAVKEEIVSSTTNKDSKVSSNRMMNNLVVNHHYICVSVIEFNGNCC